MKIFRILLFPFSIIYGLGVFFRNLAYDFKIVKTESFKNGIISVGNLSSGGTGKSPLIEYLIRLLISEKKIATLSRGYGRKTKGYVEVKTISKPIEVGDEPLQFKIKFPEIEVAVDTDRVNGVKKLLQLTTPPDIILLDDAFQHRKINPGISILLTDYNAIYTGDLLLPAGNLREMKSGAKRADIIVVTKVPQPFSPMEKRVMVERVSPLKHQSIFFSFINYGNFTPLYSKENIAMKSKEYYLENKFVILLFTGIASSVNLVDYLKAGGALVKHIRFRDHHKYSSSDIRRIKQLFNNIATEKKLILTTEKDAVKLKNKDFENSLKDFPIFYIPIFADFLNEDKRDFNEKILDYAKKH